MPANVTQTTMWIANLNPHEVAIGKLKASVKRILDRLPKAAI